MHDAAREDLRASSLCYINFEIWYVRSYHTYKHTRSHKIYIYWVNIQKDELSSNDLDLDICCLGHWSEYPLKGLTVARCLIKNCKQMNFHKLYV